MVFKRNVPKATLRSFRKQTGPRRQLPSQLVLGSRPVPHMVWRFQITAPCPPSSLSTKRHVERSDKDHYMEREATSPNPVLCFKTKLRTKQLGDTLLMAAECKCPLKESALSEKNIFNALWNHQLGRIRGVWLEDQNNKEFSDQQKRWLRECVI